MNAQYTEETPATPLPNQEKYNDDTPSQPLCKTTSAKESNQENAATACNPPIPDPCLPPNRWDLRGSLIYWYSNQSGMGYTTEPESTFTTSDFSAGTLVNPTYDWDPGFRVDAAYGFNQSYWSLSADVIWYRGTGDGSRNTVVTNGLFPAFSFANDSLSTDYANHATIHWTLHSTIFDLLASYEWICNSYFTLIPSLGIRNAWLTEKGNIHYRGGTYQAATDIVHLKSSFYGIGPRLALKPQFLLGRGFSFYAEGAGAVFGGWFDVHQSEKFLSTTRASVTRKVSGVRWGIDTTAGFVYTHDISNKTNVSFDLGFDYFVFFRQNEFVHGPQYTLPSQGSALTLYGGHAAVGFSF